MIEFIKNFSRDTKYYLNKEYSFPEYKMDVLNIYIEFSKLNKGFVSSKSSDDIKLPTILKTPTKEKLQKIYPGADNAFVSEINTFASKYDINTKERMAMFLAQVIHESGGFKKLRESSSFSSFHVFGCEVTTNSPKQEIKVSFFRLA
jgi:hypothetical protein